MAVQISRSKPPVAAEEVLRAENTIGESLPEDYKRFLLEHNGGRPVPAGFPIRWNKPELARGAEFGMVGDFYAIYEGKPVNLLEGFRSHGTRIPKGAIAIARDPGGNLILLGLSGEHRGKVFFWLHDMDPEYDETAFENLGVIANSFDEFLQSLLEIPR